SAALSAQLFFLLQRVEQLRRLRQADLFQPRVVADYLFEKDRVFAELNLDVHEFALYDKVYRQLAPEVSTPDLVIYLQAPVEVMQRRITQLGIDYEQVISSDYLARLSEAYIRFFYHYDRSPLLIVNTRDINPVENEDDYGMLLERIRSISSGRHYFNPTPI